MVASPNVYPSDLRFQWQGKVLIPVPFKGSVIVTVYIVKVVDLGTDDKLLTYEVISWTFLELYDNIRNLLFKK